MWSHGCTILQCLHKDVETIVSFYSCFSSTTVLHVLDGARKNVGIL